MPGSRLPGRRFGEQTGGAADKGGENQQTNAHDRDLWIRVHSNDRSLGGPDARQRNREMRLQDGPP